MNKNSLIMPAITLCLICLITTGLLGLTFSLTQTAREEQEALALNASRKMLYPSAMSFDDSVMPGDPAAYKGLLEAYVARDEADGNLGYLLKSEYPGYGGKVQIMVAISPEGVITGISILDNSETPGLGNKIEKQAFYGQFANQAADQTFAVKNSDSSKTTIDAIAGATISSRAVTESVNIATRYYLDLLTEVK